ncbi:septal ring lytic transglycosylase RlpA family protein [Echinicola marina]|uniref:septal ring lytic transglycosylase RlpA family protein n=1 Tax=Echinicola marina TaxID=2859768 RepID=UPI00293D4A66|nr:septal ring lytic transglycosylase RlpA family protein [Echinicola marina]UCS95024.1 septal ring lytic transglycosylase RlpA family protein [Echinicola marina]
MKKAWCLIVCLVALMGFKATAQPTMVASDSTLLIEKGIASYYGRFFHNRRTANGEIFDMEGMTAAHKHLPFGTMVRVTNLKNGKEIVVKINDRLPQNSRRTIDLAKGAAKKLGMIQMGLAPVHISVLKPAAMAHLIDYYEDETPESLRLRLYYEPIEVEKDLESLFSWTALELSDDE